MCIKCNTIIQVLQRGAKAEYVGGRHHRVLLGYIIILPFYRVDYSLGDIAPASAL